ncbi:uncharacterized protein [Onthophagus taurus]|uniref:uncharacterized protein n=1 Tax=Onthophagus taurus TaxID=166361 RepID=UPI0039BE2889
MSCESEKDFFFNVNNTRELIKLYGLYRSKVGTSSNLKNINQMWVVIANELSTNGVTITDVKCQNRWKVLERNYKKLVDNDRKTGRGRKIFEFENEMHEVLGRKRSIHPKVLLSAANEYPLNEPFPQSHTAPHSETTSTEESRIINITPSTSQIIQHSSPIDPNSVTLSIPETPKQKRKARPTVTYRKRNDILLEMKNDLKAYYDKKIEYMAAKEIYRQRKLEILEEHLALQREKNNKN